MERCWSDVGEPRGEWTGWGCYVGFIDRLVDGAEEEDDDSTTVAGGERGDRVFGRC